MRKPVFPRIITFILLYCGIFGLLIIIQFARQEGFTQPIGLFLVSGSSRSPLEATTEEHQEEEGEEERPQAASSYQLRGSTAISFGGLVFHLAGESEGPIILVQEDGSEFPLHPEVMEIYDDTAVFRFPLGVELTFSSRISGGVQELLISGVFPDYVAGLEIPISSQRRTGIRNTEEGPAIFHADGLDYSFGQGVFNAQDMTLSLGRRQIAYREIPEGRILVHADFILPEAQNIDTYSQLILAWRNQNVSLWEQPIGGQYTEDMVIASVAEAFSRGSYRGAVAAVPPSFLQSTQRTYASSVYLGGMDMAQRSFNAQEQGILATLTAEINGGSLGFLNHPRVFEYLSVRGHMSLFDAARDLIYRTDPASLSLPLIPGILEAYLDLAQIQPNSPNPLEALMEQSLEIIFESLLRSADGTRVLVFEENRGSTLFNLRLGRALSEYGAHIQDPTWTGIGRSLVLSALSLGDPAGLVPAVITFSLTGDLYIDPEGGSLTSAALHSILRPLELYPRALTVSSGPNPIWAWMGANLVSTARRTDAQFDVLDIIMNFPVGESHYVIIQGIPPFGRMQLYGVDYRSDPQFENYNSSGWVYYPQTRTLVLKMLHRSAQETVRIIFREPPPPPPPPPAEEASPEPEPLGGINLEP